MTGACCVSDEDFDHTIGLSPRSSTGSYGPPDDTVSALTSAYLEQLDATSSAHVTDGMSKLTDSESCCAESKADKQCADTGDDGTGGCKVGGELTRREQARGHGEGEATRGHGEGEAVSEDCHSSSHSECAVNDPEACDGDDEGDDDDVTNDEPTDMASQLAQVSFIQHCLVIVSPWLTYMYRNSMLYYSVYNVHACT